MSDIQEIPLRSFHAERGARFVPFAGWNMPVQYTSILQEHLAVRQSVGLFDVSHMGEILLEGSDAVKFLNYLLTNDYSNLNVGASKYSMMCYPDGGVVDDLIVYRLDDQRYLVCVNASNCTKDFGWMQRHAEGFDVRLEDASARYALLALQGPRAAELLQPLVDGYDLDALKRFHHANASVAGVEVLLSATGYTGELGFELYIAADTALAVAEALHERALEMQLSDFYCGLGARDSLRLEAGYPLYGHEISESIDPLTAGLGWTVKFKKPDDFIGRSALAKLKEEGLDRQVCFFKLGDRRIARQGETVWRGDQPVGEVCSGTFSPIAGVAIGSMWVRSMNANSGGLEVRLRGKVFPVELVKPPIR